MRRNHTGIVLALAIGTGASWAGAGLANPALRPEVTIEAGRLGGAFEGGVAVYRGIPFAKAPVGALRWRPPQPVTSWVGARLATTFGHDCMSKPVPTDAAPLGASPSEDCLFINVWRPGDRRKNLPVMVWIYGGGFVNGGSSPSVYDGRKFAQRGVILVSFNYRLGRFGFFGFPALTAEHPDELKANYGYMDQLLALRWVQRNIAAFGGDPRNVTVFGESAGGMSVHMLLTSPLARGLFSKAIVESGAGRSVRSVGLGERFLSRSLPGKPSLEEIGVNFARSKGISGTDAAALAQLRALPADQLVSGLNMTTMTAQASTYGGPVIDGRIVTSSAEEAYRAGLGARVPLIVGANSADIGIAFATTIDDLFAPFGAARSGAMAAYGASSDSDLRVMAAAVAGDRMMVEPARFVASSFAAHGLPTYEYRFSYVADSMRETWRNGAPHASEIPYVFDTVAIRYGSRLSETDEKVANLVNAYWANFARTGNPNGPGLPAWPRYDAKSDKLLEFGSDGSAMAKPDPRKSRLDAVAALSR